MLCLLVQMKKVADEFDICFFVCIWTFLADDVHRFIGVLCSTQVLDEALLVLALFMMMFLARSTISSIMEQHPLPIGDIHEI